MASVPKLTTMISLSPQFSDSAVDDYIPIDRQHLFMTLAERFQSKTSSLYEDPAELYLSMGIGSEEIWEEFLNIEPVRLYVSARTKNLTAVHARKSLKNLQLSAGRGDVQSIKYLNEISGVLNKQTDNRIIVLSYVPRPQIQEAGVEQK